MLKKFWGNKSRKFKIISIVLIVVIAGAIVIGGVISSGNANAGNAELQTITLVKTDLTKNVSASGSIQSSDKLNIYSTQTNPIQEIYVKEGDRVSAGDVLAILDISKLANDIAQAQVNLKAAQTSASEEARSNANSITNAETSLASSQLSLERQRLSTANAEKDLGEAEAKMNESFDSYNYDKTIEDTKITLDRRNIEYKDAERDYRDAKKNFDGYTYEYSIDSARSTLRQRENDLSDAQSQLQIAQEGDDESLIETAQTAVDSAQRAVEDARRAYNKAQDDLDRAQENAVSTTKSNLTKAENALDDAQRAYDRAVTEKQRAKNDFHESNKTKLENAQRTYNDSQNQLESAQNSLLVAQNSLAQAKNKPATSGTTVELRQLDLQKLNKQLAESTITALADGVVTEVNTNVGATPNGVLFVIENSKVLYATANVKEYNIYSVSLGDMVYITTDATGDKTYEATVSFIAPKAASATGTTNVEFEVQAIISNADDLLKMGMNAFLNIVTETIEDVYSVPLSMIITNERGNFVYAFENGETKEISVAIGLKTTTAAEIIGDGLLDGLQLITNPTAISNQLGGRGRQ